MSLEVELMIQPSHKWRGTIPTNVLVRAAVFTDHADNPIIEPTTEYSKVVTEET